MPQIPLIGAPGPLQIQPVESPERDARYAAGAIDNAGNVIAAGGAKLQAQADADTKARQDAVIAVAHQQEQGEANVQITNASSNAHVNALTSFQDALNSGNTAGATAATLKQFDQQTQDGLSAIMPAYQPAYQQKMADLRGALAVSLGQREIGARNIQLGSDTSDGTQSDARLAMVDPSQAGSLMDQRAASIAALPLPPEEKTKLLDQSRQTTAFAAAGTMVDKNPQGFLDSLTPDGVTKDPVLSALAPANMETLRNHATTLVLQQANAAQHAKDAAEKLGQDTYNGLVDFVNKGGTPDLNYISQVGRDTLGTSVGPQSQDLLKMAAKSAGFGSQSLPQQQVTLSALESQLSNGSNPDEQKMLASLHTISSSQQSAFKDDPLAAYTQFAKGPAMPPQQVGSVDDAMKLVQQRAGLLPSIEAYGGVQGVSPLHPAEASQLADIIRKLPADQAAGALGSLATAAGSAPRIAAIANQFGDPGGVLRIAMGYAGIQTGMGQQIAKLILQGDQALKDKTSDEDKTQQTGWKAAIATDIRGAYLNPQQENDAIEAAYRIRASEAVPGGPQGISGDLDTAVKLATNGVITHGVGKTTLPVGMTEDQFNDKLGAVTPESLQAQAPDSKVVFGKSVLPLATFVSQLPNATLGNVGNGRYVVKSGNSFATTTAGQPLILNLK